MSEEIPKEEKLKEFFERAYQRNEWLNLLERYLSIGQFTRPIPIEGNIEGSVESFCQLGKKTLADNKELGIYEIKTNSQVQLHRNRVQMRQLVAGHCNKHEGDVLDGALAVYYNDLGQWRFSFISMEYRLNEQGELNTQESHPKRFTYLLGAGAKVRTAVTRFSHLDEFATLDSLKDAFAVEQLNKEFYKKLFCWYEHAKKRVVFPNDEYVDEDRHVSISLIRMLTRLLFVWFIKEKKLVNPDFFDFEKVRKIVDWDKDSSYYKAILQNLFFATLDRKIADRGFHATPKDKSVDSNCQATSLYRYQDLFLCQDKTRITELFDETPFLNGGLFECLDKDIRTDQGVIRTDGFFGHSCNPLCVPNDLFFSNDKKNLGLIQLLAQYQFTVEESTPLDVDVALDPELLGRVFENLLASYNPETQQTARKESGSFYTPREIVSYMVDESLQKYFEQVCDFSNEKICHLFQSGITKNTLNNNETENLIQAINKIKVLDPAVGSGAFPMGVLQRLVRVLNIIDPENKRWKQRQIDIINKLPDVKSRKQALREVETIFGKENHFNDFGRKLYLIQNCIYGVDIQPIAVQIAKLRFFISLIIEQQPTDNKHDNYGIEPLPNLETRFVAADSLMGLQLQSPQMDIFDQGLVESLQKLEDIRCRHFNAKALKTKREYQKEDEILRKKILEKLQLEDSSELTKNKAQKIARLDLYDQNASVDWFEPEWMFSISTGFNIVIGNPPYIQLSQDKGRLGNKYEKCDYQTFDRTGDIYQLFYERAFQLLIEQGHLCYITSNKWMRAKYGEKSRKFFAENNQPLKLLDFRGFKVFENATVDTSILLTQKTQLTDQLQATSFKSDFQKGDNIGNYVKRNAVSINVTSNTWFIGSRDEVALKEKIERIGITLKEWDISIYYGIKTGYNPAFIIDNETKEALVAADPNSAEVLKPILRGRNVKRYQTQWAGLWLIDSHNGYGDIPPTNIEDYPAIKQHLDKHYPRLERRRDRGKTPYNLRNCAYYTEFEREKIIWGNLSIQPRFSVDNDANFISAPTNLLTAKNHIKYIAGVLNSQLCYWIMTLLAYSREQGYMEYKKTFVEQIPVPIETHQNYPLIIQIENLVDQILIFKRENLDTTVLEARIDALVYQIYELKKGEIKLITKILQC